MKRVHLMATLVIAVVFLAGCAQSPPPAPTAAPAAPPKAAEPTKAATQPAAAPTKAIVQPTVAPTKAAAPSAQPAAAQMKPADYPAKNRSITMIVPYAAGSTTDIGTRILATTLEKVLGASIDVVNKTGGTGQLGATELAKAKPDGYTLALLGFPPVILSYIDPERQAVYTRKDFQPVAMYIVSTSGLGVRADSPYKTLKDLIDAAKANPKKIRVGTSGVMGVSHLGALVLQKQAGVEFAFVHFEGSGPSSTAMLGGHVESVSAPSSIFVPLVKDNKARVLGIMDTEESKYLPGVKTMSAQGYDVIMGASYGIVAPGGTPIGIVSYLAASIREAMQSEEMKKKLEDIGLETRYMDTNQLTKFWTDMEPQVKDLIEMAKAK